MPVNGFYRGDMLFKDSANGDPAGTCASGLVQLCIDQIEAIRDQFAQSDGTDLIIEGLTYDNTTTDYRYTTQSLWGSPAAPVAAPANYRSVFKQCVNACRRLGFVKVSGVTWLGDVKETSDEQSAACATAKAFVVANQGTTPWTKESLYITEVFDDNYDVGSSSLPKKYIRTQESLGQYYATIHVEKCQATGDLSDFSRHDEGYIYLGLSAQNFSPPLSGTFGQTAPTTAGDQKIGYWTDVSLSSFTTAILTNNDTDCTSAGSCPVGSVDFNGWEVDHTAVIVKLDCFNNV
jgi:hypothetical protein